VTFIPTDLPQPHFEQRRRSAYRRFAVAVALAVVCSIDVAWLIGGHAGPGYGIVVFGYVGALGLGIDAGVRRAQTRGVHDVVDMDAVACIQEYDIGTWRKKMERHWWIALWPADVPMTAPPPLSVEVSENDAEMVGTEPVRVHGVAQPGGWIVIVTSTGHEVWPQGFVRRGVPRGVTPLPEDHSWIPPREPLWRYWWDTWSHNRARRATKS